MAQLKKYIPLKQLADFHQVSVSLITEFADFGLIEIRYTENAPYLSGNDMEKCERAIRLYKDLGINMEGIEIILEMREKQVQMQKELNRLRHMLRKHEERMSEQYLSEFFDVD